MRIQTRCFGEIDLSEEKIITFERGLFGFEDYKRYTILFDIDEEDVSISWLQSVDEPSLALPVINPGLVKKDYNPVLEDELLDHLGELTEENIIVFVTVSVPQDVKNTTVNLKAPIVINSDTRKGCQVVAENQDYPVKYKVYHAASDDNGKDGAS